MKSLSNTVRFVTAIIFETIRFLICFVMSPIACLLGGVFPVLLAPFSNIGHGFKPSVAVSGVFISVCLAALILGAVLAIVGVPAVAVEAVTVLILLFTGWAVKKAYVNKKFV